MTDAQWTAVKNALCHRLAEAKKDVRVEVDILRHEHALEEDFYADMIRRAQKDDPGFDFTVTIRRAFTHDPVQIVCRYENSTAL